MRKEFIGKRIIPKINKHKLIIMNLTAILLCFSILFAYAENSYSQKMKLSFNLKSTSIKTVFKEIEQTSDFIFVLSDNIENEINKKVSVSVNTQTVDVILDKILGNTGLTYKIYGRQVVIYRNENKPNPKVNEVLQKRHTIKGIVKDQAGNTIPGVNISVIGSTRGVITDNDGSFILEVEAKDKILFSFIGLENQTIEVGDKTFFNIIMEEKTALLDGVQVVAFGTQKKSSIVSAITTIKPSELKMPSSNLTASLAGRIAGLISYQRSAEPGKDNAEFFIRGVTTFGYAKSPLILIDGIEVSSSDLARLTPDDIASFSIMKDATSSALYGARGANGVILVTTKEGTEGKLNTSIRIETSLSTPTQKIDIADPITYMLMHNEATTTRNPLVPQPYSQEKIDNTIAGTNPYAFPATDWYGMLIKDFTTNHRINLNLNGGGRVARYYVSANYNVDNGILNVDKKNNFNSNVKSNNIAVRSNININLTKSTEMILRMNGTFTDYQGPISGGSAIFNQVMRTNPVLFPAFYEPDEARSYTKHILFGNSGNANYINPYANLVQGYRNESNTMLLAQLELHQNFDIITKGLKGRILLNTKRSSYFDVSRGYNPYYYNIDKYDRRTDKYTLNALNELYGTDYLNYSEGEKQISSSFYLETAMQWNRTFNNLHDVSGLLVYTMRNSLYANAGSLQRSLPYRNMGFAGRATYAYDDRYMFELNFGYNGSERFAKKNRFGFFPSVGVAWNVSNESFFEQIKESITHLKLKATYGLVGNDAIGDASDRFFYLSEVNMNSGTAPGFGTNFNSPISRPTVSIDRYANELITWEKAKKTDIGVELTLFNDFVFQADYFNESRSNILMDRASITPEMGLEAPVRANVGKAFSEGFDGSLNINKVLSNDWWIQGRFNFTYAIAKYKVYEEPVYFDTPWLSRKNTPITQQRGYIAERLFLDESEVLNSPKQFGEYMAGDIKYRDINSDGVIDYRDKVSLGYPTSPEIVYGFGISLGNKNLDFSFFFQGLARESFWIDQYATAPFIDTDGNWGVNSNNALLNVYANNHWSESNQNPYALWPRFSSQLVENNNQTSSWFMRDGSFLRLKSLEVGYTLPNKIITKLGMTNLRVYLNGSNLLSFSNFKLWDPEMAGNGLSYPIQRVFNLGVQTSF